MVAAPLIMFLKKGPMKCSWIESAEVAFNKLKQAFTTAFILAHPDPDRIRSCLLLQEIIPAEINSNVTNCDLLAIKLALEEWRHRLEGAAQLFMALTNYKNLWRMAKHQNPQQAHQTLFFSKFSFVLSYRPGSKKTKADALSHIHPTTKRSSEPENTEPVQVLYGQHYYVGAENWKPHYYIMSQQVVHLAAPTFSLI